MRNKFRKAGAAALAAVMLLGLCLLSGCGLTDFLGSLGTHTVTFQLNGGELISGALIQQVKNGQAAVAPEAENGKLALSWDKDFSEVREDMVVVAQWSKVAMPATELAAYVQARTVTVDTVHISGGESSGSGFFIDDQGTLVTNYHVIEGACAITVRTFDGSVLNVLQVIDYEPNHDLAVLKADCTGNEYLELAEEEAVTGEPAYAVGSPLGFLDGTFTAGTISATSRAIGLIDCLQMDAAISHGNSGGPLVNEYGEVLGVNSFGYSEGENLNLAIKVKHIRELPMDKNLTVREYEEWYTTESARSWSPQDDYGYYYSTVNTYQAVTGAACLYSVTGEEYTDGYVDMNEYYIYEYNTAQYDEYVAYLKTEGFLFDSDEAFSGGTSYYYYNEVSGVLIDLFVTSDSQSLMIWVYA